MSPTSWTIKASKFCNLRCRYCYEWPHLADPARMTLAMWRRVLAAVRWYHERCGAGAADRLSGLIWHGGEPLALPVDYWCEVAALQRELLRDEPGSPLNYRTGVQTNLYAVSEKWLALFEQEQMLVGVSFDGVPGLRVSARGNATEGTVLANTARLRERGIRFGGAVVLTADNREALPEIYDQLKQAGASYVKIIPLLPADHFSASASFSITTEQIVVALRKLYLHWSADSTAIPVIPLDDCVRTVRLSRLNLSCDDFDRRTAGEQRFIVDTNGDLYTQPGQYGAEYCLGNLLRNSLTEILTSPRYEHSLSTSDGERRRHCGACSYHPACDTRAAQSPSASRGSSKHKRCQVKAALCDFIDAHLDREESVDLALS